MSAICILATICVIAYFAGKLFLAHLSEQENEQVQGRGNFNQAVVGESSYLGDLRSIAGGGEVFYDCTAVLVLEDANQYDSNAVAIFIHDRKVGYLSRTDAKRYRGWRRGNGANVECPARIIGGGRGRENLGVWLDITF